MGALQLVWGCCQVTQLIEFGNVAFFWRETFLQILSEGVGKAMIVGFLPVAGIGILYLSWNQRKVILGEGQCPKSAGVLVHHWFSSCPVIL